MSKQCEYPVSKRYGTPSVQVKSRFALKQSLIWGPKSMPEGSKWRFGRRLGVPEGIGRKPDIATNPKLDIFGITLSMDMGDQLGTTLRNVASKVSGQ